MNRSFYEMIIARGGGIVTCPDHLGVVVGSDPKLCPAGWGFVDITEATPELISEVVEHVKLGRKNWPEKVSEV